MSRISRPVWLLGWSSLFTDAATEMIYPVLPVYLSRVLGASAFSLGLIEGVAEAVNSLLKVGKGIRGAPRDVMLARFATAFTRGRVFGFHRAMNHTGAILGPLMATAHCRISSGASA